MKTIKSSAIRSVWPLTLVTILTVATVHSCSPPKTEEDHEQEPVKDTVVEIITENMDFQMPDTIPSGWNIFKYSNLSPQTHFFLVDDYPDGKTLADTKAEILPPFDKGMKLINEGKSEEGFAEFGKLPEWFSEVKFVGGTGLISPGYVGETMIKLDPGYYIVECYVKMSNGVFHGSMGMTKELIVSDVASGISELTPDVSITVSSTDGIVFSDSITRGVQTFSVFYQDQIAHENFVGHDISLAKLNETASVDSLDKWMNWADPKGLIEPAPEGVTFLGGVNDLPQGNTGYFRVTLEPGNYVLVSEVPNPLSKNMLKQFTVL